MNFLGIGSLELLVVMIIGVTVVGPKRLILGVRTFKKFLTKLKEQRDYITELIIDEENNLNEAIEENIELINPVPIKTDKKISKQDSSISSNDSCKLNISCKQPSGNVSV